MARFVAKGVGGLGGVEAFRDLRREFLPLLSPLEDSLIPKREISKNYVPRKNEKERGLAWGEKEGVLFCVDVDGLFLVYDPVRDWSALFELK